MSRYPSSWSWDFSAIVGVGSVHEDATLGLGPVTGKSNTNGAP